MVGFIDRVGFSDRLEIEVIRDTFVSPNNPCPKCGSETKKHHDKIYKSFSSMDIDKEGNLVEIKFNTRICSNKECRNVIFIK